MASWLKTKLITIFTILTVSSAGAQEISPQEISRYLQGFTTAKAEFLQINPDESTQSGTLWLHRPGRLRFEYDPPHRDLVIAGGSQLAIFDSRSNTGPKQYPLSQTPLNIILENNVNVTNERFFREIDHMGNTTVLTLQDKQRPEIGILELVFTANPTTLRQWNIQDGGGITRIILRNIEPVQSIPSHMFSITHESNRRGNSR